MNSGDSSNRTHEPDFRELVSDVDALRVLMESEFRGRDAAGVERDRRYTDKFTALDEKTTTAQATSKEAITKAETATEKRFDSVNEFRSAMSDQSRLLMPRAEADARFGSVAEKIEEMKKIYDGALASLHSTRSEAMGRQQIMTIVISLAASAIGAVLMRVLLR